MIKKNYYSEALSSALEAVSAITSPDYVLMPVDPSRDMMLAGARAAGITLEQAREAYASMMLEWAAGQP